MYLKLHELLAKRYPVYDQKHHPQTIFGAFGFQCGAGWLELFIDLAERLNEMGIEPAKVELREIKEKHWSARFYAYVPAYADSEEYDDFIEELEERSKAICQFCGHKKHSSVREHDCDPEHVKQDYLLKWYRSRLSR